MDHSHVQGARAQFGAPQVRSDTGRSALGARIQWKIEAKLGRCRRCMTISAVSFVIAWALVVALTLLHPRPVLPLGAATVVAVLLSGVALAHALAFATYRRQRVAGPATALPATVTPARRGCGCGSNTA